MAAYTGRYAPWCARCARVVGSTRDSTIPVRRRSCSKHWIGRDSVLNFMLMGPDLSRPRGGGRLIRTFAPLHPVGAINRAPTACHRFARLHASVLYLSHCYSTHHFYSP